MSIHEGIDWEAYYQKLAELSDFNPESDWLTPHRGEALWSVFPRGRFSSVLDVGCGDGYLVDWLSVKPELDSVMGFDLSRLHIQRAAKRYPDRLFLLGGIGSMPFPDDCFDALVSTEVLEHLMEPGEALKEMARVARQYIVVTVPDRQVLAEMLCPHCLKTFYPYGHLHSFDESRMAELGKEAGLTMVGCESYHIPVRVGPEWLGAFLRKIQRKLAPAPGAFLAACYRVK